MKTNCIFYNSFKNRDYFELKKELRPYDTILIVKEGSFKFQIENEEFIIAENEVAHFPANAIFSRQIITPVTFHQFAFTTDDSEIFAILKGGKLNIPRGHVKAIIESLELLVDNSQTEDIYPQFIKNIAVEHYIHTRSANLPKGIYPKDITSVVDYMSDNMHEKLSVPKMAKMINLSHVGLIWKFRKFVGTTPSQYLIKLRMQTAKNLLLDGELSIKNVAQYCGYDNPYYFSNAFSDFYGTSPSKFRKLHNCI